MPWLAVPFSARAAQAAMASRFKVQGIPALVLIEDGEVINASARGAVMKDPAGAAFPWKGQEDLAGCVLPAMLPCRCHIMIMIASHLSHGWSQDFAASCQGCITMHHSTALVHLVGTSQSASAAWGMLTRLMSLLALLGHGRQCEQQYRDIYCPCVHAGEVVQTGISSLQQLPSSCSNMSSRSSESS